MPVVVKCPACGHDFLATSAAGKGRTCPKCKRAIPDSGSPVPVAGPATSSTAASGSTTAQGQSIRPGAKVGDRFELVDELGRGAFGVVWKAKDTRLKNKPVAVKMLLERALATPDAVKRFRAEADLLCSVNHAHVPAVLDLGEFANQQYIVFAFVHGQTLRDVIPEGGMLDVVAGVRLAAKLSRTLHDIYSSKSILHRDVKPANVMVPFEQQDGLYLMDFGLAVCHDTDETRTQDGTVLGTPWYMSPEQAEGRIQEIGHASDLYSAAAVLYHVLTGRPPFNTKGLAVLSDIRFTSPQPPSYFRPGLDGELDGIVLHGLNKMPQDRFHTGAEFAEQLELWAARAKLMGSRIAVPAGGYYVPAGPPSQSKRSAVSTGEASSIATGSTVGPHAPRPMELPPDPRLTPRGA